MVLTNFRSRDFKKDGDEAVKMVRSKRDVYDVDSPKVEASTPIVAENADPEAVPAGTVKEILTWVGEDLERAQKALDVETENDKPRKGLVDALVELIDAEANEAADNESEESEKSDSNDEEKSE